MKDLTITRQDGYVWIAWFEVSNELKKKYFDAHELFSNNLPENSNIRWKKELVYIFNTYLEGKVTLLSRSLICTD